MRIFGSVAELIINGMRDSTLVMLAWKRRCGTPDVGVQPPSVRPKPTKPDSAPDIGRRWGSGSTVVPRARVVERLQSTALAIISSTSLRACLGPLSFSRRCPWRIHECARGPHPKSNMKPSPEVAGEALPESRTRSASRKSHEKLPPDNAHKAPAPTARTKLPPDCAHKAPAPDNAHQAITGRC